ncbi:MAG: magnesium/cobalt transporter CorA [Trueperaceae bacterium]|nr:magnesium/cobalt transporter CorA [Trueperaceae bacterium]
MNASDDPSLRRSGRAVGRASRRLTGRRATPGAPGSVTYTGHHPPVATRVRLLRFGPTSLDEREIDAATALRLAAAPGDEMTWIDVVGLADHAFLSELGRVLGLHPLWIEDIANVGQRPKHESVDEALLIVMRSLRVADDSEHPGLEAEQVSIVIGPRLVVTFQERPGDPFDGVRARIRRTGSRLRTGGPDYLAYALVDTVVEEAFALLERYGDAIVDLEDEAFRRPSPAHLQRIHALRMDALQLRRTVWPTRDLLAGLLRDDTELLGREARTFLGDVHDHAVQAVDAVETLRELLSGLQESTLSTLSFRMNEVMKVLTVISTVFIPLTFIVGVYGMNFQHMPELGWRWAYPALWLAMITLAFGLAQGFRRRGWW